MQFALILSIYFNEKIGEQSEGPMEIEVADFFSYDNHS